MHLKGVRAVFLRIIAECFRLRYAYTVAIATMLFLSVSETRAVECDCIRCSGGVSCRRLSCCDCESSCHSAFCQKERLFDSSLRESMESRGIAFDGDFIGNFLGNPSGGRRQRFRSAWRSTFGLTFDLEKRRGIEGARFRVSGAWTDGQNLGTDVETIFNPAEIFGLRGWRFWELYWGQKLCDDQLDVIIGRHSPGEVFTVQPPVWDYVNLGFYPMTLMYNDFGYRTRPIGMWGVSGRLDPHQSPLYLIGGVFSGAPRDLQRTTANGLDFTIDLNESTFAMFEIGYKRNQSQGAAGLPGTYRFGVAYNSARFDSLSDPNVSKRSNFNFYFSGEQTLSREPCSQTQGLDAFGQVAFPGDEEINVLTFFATGGLVYTGLIEGRDADRTYCGVAYAEITDAIVSLTVEAFQGPAIVPNQPYETVIEVGHVIQATPFWAITPAAQYIVNPGLTDDVDDAFVLGLQTVVTF